MPSAAPMIARRYLHDEAAERLRALIESGELEPGDRVPEVEISARFGISRTPMREAIKILATEGLLELLPNKGARVTRIGSKEVDEMLEVIGGLEGLAADLACNIVTEKEIEVIEQLHAEMVAAHKARDAEHYAAKNRAIHEAIVAASHNATLIGLYQNLSSRVQRMRYAAPKSEVQWRSAIADHVRIIEFLRNRDGSGLMRLMREHQKSKKDVIVAAYG